MGLFDSKYVHHVGTAIQPLVDPAAVVDPYSLAIFEANQTGVDLVDNILETSLHTISLKSKLYYNHVKNKYPQKMPTGEMVYDTRFRTAAEAVIRGLHPGANPTFTFTKFGPANGYFEGWRNLIDQYQYDPLTGKLNALEDEQTETALTSVRLVLPDTLKSVISVWETTNWMPQETYGSTFYTLAFNQLVPSYPSNPVSFISGASPHLLVTYSKKVTEPFTPTALNEFPPPPITTTEELAVPLSLLGNGKEYYQVHYKVGEQTYFWFYEFKSGGYISLDSVLDEDSPPDKLGQFFPNTYYRLNKAAPTDTAYISMARKIGMNYADMLESIEANQDIGDVESALFTFGISIDGTSEVEIRYLFDFFSKLKDADSNDTWSLGNYTKNWLFDYSTSNQELRNAIHIKDDVFKYALTYEKVTRTSHAGTIGAVGFASKELGAETRQRNEMQLVGMGEDASWQPVPTNYTVPYYSIKKQVSQSFWEEVRVYDLAMVYWVFDEYKTTLNGDNPETDAVELCVIPLDRVILDTYNAKDKNELLHRSMHFVFNSYVVQKISWYQRGWFKDLLTVAALVYTIVTFDPSALSATLAQAGAFAVIQMLAIKVLINVAIVFALKVFVKAVGLEIAILAAIVAAAYGFYGESFASLTPDQLLNLASYTFDAVQGAVKEMFADLKSEMESFLSLKTEMEKELQAAMDLLKPRNDPFTPILLGETPDQFLYRTTVFGTSGLTQLNAVGDYVDKSLYLPNTAATLGVL